MAEELLNVKGEILQSGVFPGLPNQQVPLWKQANNFVFKEASAKVSGAHLPLFDKGSSLAGLGVLPVNNTGSPALVWGSREALYRGLVSPVTVDVTRVAGAYTGTDSDTWSIVQFGQSILATNGIDEIQYLVDVATTANFVNLSSVSDLRADFRCKILVSTGAYILAFNTDNTNTEYIWCTEDDLTVWLPNAGNSARDIQVRDLGSDIVAVTELGALNLIYGRDQVHIFAFTNAPIYFPNEHLIDGIGAVSKHAIVQVGRQHFGFGSNGLFTMDGSSFEYISDQTTTRSDLLSS